jgi:spermidine/putrescine transport system ATP-binding protein
MQAELHALQRSLAATFIHVTHDQEEAMSIADTIVLLNRGRVEDIGPPERVYRRPASLFAATFMGDTNLLEGTITSVANGTAVIETPLGNVLAEGGGTVGTKVRLSIRPECIRVGNSNADSGVSFGRARLHDFVFQGTHLRCQASIANDRELVLRLAADNMVTPETTVDLWVQSRDVVLINREGT